MARAALKKKVTPIPVRFGEDEMPLYRVIEARARAQGRSVSGQLKYYARLGMIAMDNPDLPLSMIEGILEAREELKAGLGQPYQWGVLENQRA
jgi:hypothetical protein